MMRLLLLVSVVEIQFLTLLLFSNPLNAGVQKIDGVLVVTGNETLARIFHTPTQIQLNPVFTGI